MEGLPIKSSDPAGGLDVVIHQVLCETRANQYSESSHSILTARHEANQGRCSYRYTMGGRPFFYPRCSALLMAAYTQSYDSPIFSLSTFSVHPNPRSRYTTNKLVASYPNAKVILTDQDPNI